MMSEQSEASVTNDYDSPWKEILEAYFEECIAFFFPDTYRDVDWAKGYEFLDKELQQIDREAEIGKRVADKLVKVWTNAGEQVWVLIHVEVQSQRETSFSQRMYSYNYRLQDLFNRPVASFAILSDDSPTWRPHHYSSALWGTTVDFEFRTIKLLDYKHHWDELMDSENPFSVVVMAHLKALETSGDQVSRKQWKLSLIKLLYQRGYERRDVKQLLRFIDWLLALPLALQGDLWQEILTYQEEMNMPYITSLERLSMNKGLEEGRKKGLEEGREEGREEGLAAGLKRGIQIALEQQFGSSGLELIPAIEEVNDIEILDRLQERLLKNQISLDELQQLYQPGS